MPFLHHLYIRLAESSSVSPRTRSVTLLPRGFLYLRLSPQPQSPDHAASAPSRGVHHYALQDRTGKVRFFPLTRLLDNAYQRNVHMKAGLKDCRLRSSLHALHVS